MTVLAAHDIRVAFGGHTALDGVSLAAAPGETVGLIGPNAAGKTTLLRVLAGLLAPSAGHCSLDGRDDRQLPRGERARAIAYLEQGASCHWPLSVERMVSLGRLPHLAPWQRPGEADRRAVEAALERTGVGALAYRPVTELSGGERARCMLARIIATGASVLLADEPVAQLDPYHQIAVMELLQGHAADGGSVVVVLHDLALAARFCDRLILLDHGVVAAEGAPEAVLTPALLQQVYGISVEVGRRGDELYVIPWRRVDDAHRESPT